MRAKFLGSSISMVIRILADGDHVVVECRGDATTISGERYANTYCFVIRVADR